jgi:putative transposase
MSRKTAGEIYHVLNRGVDKRKIFLDDNDYLRFIHDLFEFNDENPAFNVGHHFKNQYIDVRRQYIENRRPRKFLVEILAFSLMPNHYHLLLKPKRANGLETFIKKVNGGYAKYFNNKYERSGALFQGKYKSVLVKDEAHFIHLPYYIHLNPLDLVVPEWRERKISTSDVNKIERFLEKYRWSSYLDYIGKKNFPSVTQREFLVEFLGGPEQYKKDTIKWLQEMDLEEIKDLLLE